jgi:hypothetical protein
MATTVQSNGNAVAKAKEAGDTVSSAAQSASRPALTAGAAAAGLAGGLALGARLNGRGGLAALVKPRRRVLGVPIGRKSGLHRALETLGKTAKQVGRATKQVSSTTDDIHQVREELEKANRQSPVEVLLDGLTHRRGAHRRES